MDPRLLAYWWAEAEAVQRQQMSRTAQAVRAGMADGGDYRSFMDSLELVKSRPDQATATWEMLEMMESRGYAGNATTK